MNFLMVASVEHIKPVAPSTVPTEEPSVYDVDEFKRLMEMMPTAVGVRIEAFKDELIKLIRKTPMPQEQLEQAVFHLMRVHDIEEQCAVNLERNQLGYVVHMNPVQPQPPTT